jgi:hypothetical protein
MEFWSYTLFAVTIGHTLRRFSSCAFCSCYLQHGVENSDPWPEKSVLYRTGCGISGATTCRVGFVEYELTEVASLWKRRPVAMLRYYGVGFFCSFLLAEGMRHSRGATSCLGLGNRGANSLCDNHRSILVLPRGISLGTSRYSVLCQRGSLEQAGPRAFCCVGRIQ